MVFFIVDDYSRFTWVLFLQDKSEVQETFKKFARRAQNEFEVKIKRIRSDNGSEFKNTSIEEFLDEEGIKHEFSAPYTPQQNGVVERKNRTLIEAGRTMLDEYKTSGCVEITKDVTFDESNGSQEQIDPSFVEKEELPCEAIKKLAIGEVKPQEWKEHEEEDGTRRTCETSAQSPEVPEKCPKVPDISGSSGKMAGSSGLSRFLREEQAQDRLFQDAAQVPMHEINDDQDEEHEDQSHDEEAQEPIQRE